MQRLLVVPFLFLLLSVAPAQVVARGGFVQAVGSASVSAKPDQAQIQLSVVTTAGTASDASTQNANQVTAVLNALGSLLGPNPNIQTLSYSLNPNYSNPPNGQPPVLTGYTAQNTVQVTLADLSLIGKVIDTGIQAGANRVQALQFSLKDDQPVRTQALKMATVQAKANADAMVSGVGLSTGPIISIVEGSTSTPVPVVLTGVVAGAATTPVQSGVVNISANVTIQVSIPQ